MIRPYNKKDKGALINLLRLNTPKYFSSSEEKDFLEYLELHAQNYFVVEDAGTIIGAGGINYGFDNGKTARISWAIVHPERQGEGIGTKLTHYRIEEIKKHPEINKIIVRTTQLAYAFYQKTGFTVESREKDYWAKGFDLYEMKLEIKSVNANAS